MIKMIVFALVATMLFSCNGARGVRKPYIITSKSYSASEQFAKLPPCICYYRYNIDNKFQDSCSKYELGDTIK